MEDVKYDCFVSSVSNAAIEIHIGKAQYSAVMTSGTTAICCVHKRATTYYWKSVQMMNTKWEMSGVDKNT